MSAYPILAEAATVADVADLVEESGFRPRTPVREGIRAFVAWAVILAALLLPRPAAGQQCLLAEGRAPRAVVVDAENLAARIGPAVQDLLSYVERLSGARLSVASSPWPGTNALHLATETRAVEVSDAAALQSLNQEGFLLRVREGEAWLYGRSPLAVQQAIYYLLEQWGCRWLFPGEAGEVVPERPVLALTAAMQTAQQPFMLHRQLWYNWSNLLTEEIRQSRDSWMRRNRLEFYLTGSIGHSYQHFVPRDDVALFAEHPEFFPVAGGRRVRTGQICTCHPAVRERAVQYALEYFRRNPEAGLVSISPYDGGGAWRCPECQNVKSFSDAALGLANHVAEVLQQDPATRGRMVGLYAYYDTASAPSIEAHENVMVFVATRFAFRPWPRVAARWRGKVRHLGVRDYGSIAGLHWTRPTWGLRRLEKSARLWLKLGVEGVSVESGNDWGGWGLYHYVLGRLLWDPGQDVPQLVADYLQKGYGAAAPQMRRFFGRWKAGYSPTALDSAGRDLRSALRAKVSDEVRSRLELYALYLHHLRLLESYNQASTRAERLEATRRLVAFSWRLAPTNMAYTIPLIDRYVRRDAKRNLNISDQAFDAWKLTGPIGPEETREILKQEMKER